MINKFALISVKIRLFHLSTFYCPSFLTRVFHSLYKVGRNGNFVFKGFNNSKKKVTSRGAQPDATDYYWFRSPVPNQMS